MEKTIKIGTVPGDGWGYKRPLPVSVTVRLEDGRLSISGEIARPDGKDMVSGGQNLDEIGAAFPTSPKVQRIVEVWRRWHLNDMLAGCEHQRANWDTDRTVTVYHWTLDHSHPTLKSANAAKRDAEKRLLDGETVELSDDVRAVLNAPYQVTTATDEAPAPFYKPGGISKPASEVKSVGWVRETEHPDGILSKPCEVCGYKYGTEWKREDLPAEIVAEVESW